MPRLLSLLCLWAPGAAAADEVLDESAEEIVVWGDLFARWDETRWMVTTEFGLPYGLTFAKDENAEFRTGEVQLRALIACNKEWKLGKHKIEVDCEIEDFGILAAIHEDRVNDKDVERAQVVLDEIDAKLSGAKLQLQVADDGRVTNLALDGVPRNNRRQSEMHETLRQVMSRVIVGFNLKLQRYNQLQEGKWVEYNSTVMSMPLPPGLPGSMGSNMIVHYLNRYRGHVVVQSIGKGITVVGGDNYTTDLIGVSLFDDQEGFMTERVWALDGQNTASSFFIKGNYFHAGKITMLGDGDKPDCGPTQVVNGRRQAFPGLADWVPIER